MRFFSKPPSLWHNFMRSLILILLFALCTPFSAFCIEIHFKADAVAKADMLTLKDVAEIRPDKTLNELGGLVLFPAPGPGELRCYKAGTLMAYVRDAASGEERIQWSGADNICVGSRGARISFKKLQEAIDQHLASALDHLGAGNVSFEMRNPPDTITLPEGEVEYEVIFGGGHILDARNVAVIVRVNGRVAENLSITGRIRAYLPVVAAARKLNRGDVITKDDVVMHEKNIADLRRPCLDSDEAVGKVAKRAVAMGQVLGQNDIDAPVLVKRREMVTIVLDRGPIQITTRGVATANGKHGEIIAVKNMRSKREVACEVIGRKQVRVEF